MSEGFFSLILSDQKIFEFRHRISKDLQDVLPHVFCQVNKFRRVVSAFKDVSQSRQYLTADLIGQAIEGRRVNQITARILEKPCFQIKITQTATGGIWFATSREVFGERSRASDLISEFKLVAKQKVSQNSIG